MRFIFLLLLSSIVQAKEPKCDTYVPPGGMIVNQKLGSNSYIAVGKQLPLGGTAKVAYKDKAYSRLKFTTLKKNSWVESNAWFKQDRVLVGYFNFVGQTKLKLENGFDAEALALEECPQVHEFVAAQEKLENKTEEKRIAEKKVELEALKAQSKKEEEKVKKAASDGPWTFRYMTRWYAIYTDPYGSNVHTRINDDQFWNIPHHKDCYVSPIEEVRQTTFARTLMCVDKSSKKETKNDIHKQLACKAKPQEITECEVELEYQGKKIRLVGEIRRYLDGKSRMHKNVKEELENETPY